jgi:hypothetical protein
VVAYDDLREWVDGSLAAFRSELRALLFPFLLHCYIELTQAGKLDEASHLLRESSDEHLALAHRTELNLLSQVTTAAHIETNELVRRARSCRFEVALCVQARTLLMHFLQQRGRDALLTFINTRVTLLVERRTAHPGAADDADDGGAGASALHLDAAASTAARLWTGLSDEALASANASVES